MMCDFRLLYLLLGGNSERRTWPGSCHLEALRYVDALGDDKGCTPMAESTTLHPPCIPVCCNRHARPWCNLTWHSVHCLYRSSLEYSGTRWFSLNFEESRDTEMLPLLIDLCGGPRLSHSIYKSRNLNCKFFPPPMKAGTLSSCIPFLKSAIRSMVCCRWVRLLLQHNLTWYSVSLQFTDLANNSGVVI